LERSEKKFNGMKNELNLPTQAELERLAILVEECAEVQQIAMKIMRHGYESYNPFDESKTTNRNLLNKELGDLEFAARFMMDNNDISRMAIAEQEGLKHEAIKKYLHFNKV
jgi:hypothetical protein